MVIQEYSISDIIKTILNMTNRLLIIFVLINLTSCSLYTKVQYVYEGKATYYLPNGETEVYNATYTEVFVNGIKESDNISVITIVTR